MPFRSLLMALWTFALVTDILSAASADSWIPGRLSVRFKELPMLQAGAGGLELGIPELDRINRELNGLEHAEPLFKQLDRVVEPDLRLNYLLEFDDRLDMENVAARYTETGLVEYAEPDYLRPIRRETNDPGLVNQWYLTTIDAREAWDSLPEIPDYPGMIIAVIDTGVDWNHPDLIDAIWCNPDEDLDGDALVPDDTSPGEVEERNGIDEGDNGYIDDFLGWNFVDGNNNPMDDNGHGTHCAGLAAAATDNAIGVAAAAWGSRVMCLRAGYQAGDGNTYVIQSAAANAVTYAIENGAKLVTMSFGGSQTVRTPSTAAYNSGLLCFHAAGNDDSNSSDPLDSASGMISVAASNTSDCKADFSNFGTWVDVIAPGTSMHNTCFDNTYATLQGTSRACPLAASVAALLWNTNPSLSNEQVRSQLLTTTDDIYPLACNSEYQGLLGAGRVNAYKAVNNIRETWITVEELRLQDASGDGRYMPGEGALFSLEVANVGPHPTEAVEVVLETEDTGLSFPDGMQFQLSPIPGGFSDDNFANPLAFMVNPGSVPRFIEISVTVSTANALDEVVGTLEFMVGAAGVLLYDDDVATSPVYTSCYNGFKELGSVFDWYRTATGTFPLLPGRSLDLDDYQTVLYASGGNALTFSVDEQTLFADYSATHPLLVSSQHANTDLAGQAFLADVLHAETGAGTSSFRGAKGTVDDSVSAGMVMILQGANGADNQAIPIDALDPLGGAVGFMTDFSQQFPIGVRNDNGSSRMIYLNFALEAAHNTTATMGLADALAVYLDWLGLDVAVAPRGNVDLPSGISLSPAWPNPFNPSTRLAVELNRAAQVELSVYDLRGALVARLLDGPLSAGRHEVVFGGDALASGLYFASLSVDGRPVQVQKLVLVR